MNALDGSKMTNWAEQDSLFWPFAYLAPFSIAQGGLKSRLWSVLARRATKPWQRYRYEKKNYY